MLVYVCVCARLIKVLSFLDSKKNQALISSKQWSWAKSCVENTAERAKWTCLEKAADGVEFTE